MPLYHPRPRRLGKPCVELAFDNKEDYKKQNSAPNNAVRDNLILYNYLDVCT